MLSAAITKTENKESREFMTQVYKKYRRLLFHIVRKWVSGEQDQEDIVQDAWLKLTQKASLLMSLSEAQVASYIAYTARNTAIKHLEKSSRDSKHLVSLEFSTIEETSPSTPEEDLIANEWQKEFRRVWEQIPEREKLLLERRYLFGQSNEELSYWLGCKPESVRMALTRARRTAMNELTRGRNDAES